MLSLCRNDWRKLQNHRFAVVEIDGFFCQSGFFGSEFRVFERRFEDKPVEMVAMIMRQNAQINRRQILDINRRFGQSFACQPVAEMNVVARVEKIGIG